MTLQSKGFGPNVMLWNYILFTKLPWPGDSEGTFRSSSQAATCPPVYHTRRRLHTVPLIAERQAGKLCGTYQLLNVKQGSCEYQFLVFGLTRPGIEPKSTALVADALSLRPLISYHWRSIHSTTDHSPKPARYMDECGANLQHWQNLQFWKLILKCHFLRFCVSVETVLL